MYKKTGTGFTILALFMAGCVWLVTSVDMPLGMDLRGGTELIYRLDLDHIADNPEQVANEVKDIMARRLNAFGLKELSIAVQGQNHLVVQLPGGSDSDVANIKNQIERAGTLTFRLVDRSERDTAKWEKAEATYKVNQRKWAGRMRDWNAKKKANPNFSELPPKEPKVPKNIVRLEENRPAGGGEPTYKKTILKNLPGTYLDGKYVGGVGPTLDQNMKPAVAFTMTGEGASLFGDLTGNNIKEQLAIVLDDIIVSAPVLQSQITTSGQITGNFTDEEVKGLVTVLRGGSLPTKPVPIAESSIGSMLGQESIDSGVRAVFFGLALVMLFIAIYYMAAGLVANFAIAFNILVVLAYVATFRQDLTLPGIAGILLTIGMAVDANILIFERVREERLRGKGLMQALTTGYQRAFSVIFDSNVTTVITGLVLFNFGTGPVKGFAVTLITGIVVSFISALFVTKLLLSFAVNKGLISKLKMMEAFKTPNIGFANIQRPFLIGSMVVLVLTWSLVLVRGRENYGIDFTGGARIQMKLLEGVSREDMDKEIDALAKARPELFRDKALQTLGDAVNPDETPLRYREFSILTRAGAKREEGVASAQELPKGDTSAPTPVTSTPAPATADAPASSGPAGVANVESSGAAAAELGDAQLVRRELATLFKDRLMPEAFPSEPEWTPVGDTLDHTLSVEVQLADVNSAVTAEWIKEQLGKHLGEQPKFEGIGVASLSRVESGNDKIQKFKLSLDAFEPAVVVQEGGKPTRQETFTVVSSFFREPPDWDANGTSPFALSEPFPQVVTVGPRVASDLQGKALVALCISILCIIFYVSLRFEFMFGLAAITALAHDIMMCIGFMALMDFISSRFLGGSIPIKLNLPELAALLTTIGYSINDTIVVFDRIRENLKLHSKKRLSFREVVDMSINQTLSRTIWTSFTTFLTVAALLALGGEGVRGFAFTFLIGLIAGTYSSVFVASPILIILHDRAEVRKEELAKAAS